MRYPKDLPEELSESSFVWSEGLKAGLSEKQLRNATVLRPSRGIRIPNVPDLRLADQVRAVSMVTHGSVLSHLTAARLWNFPLPPWVGSEDSTHVTRPKQLNAPRRRGVVGHRASLAPGEIAELDGLPLTSRLKTWLDLACMLPVADLVVIGDHLVRLPRPAFEARDAPFATAADLREIIRLHKGKRGVAKAAEAVGLVRVGADSAPETRLRLALADAGLPEPSLNEPIVDDWGRSWHAPDMQFKIYKLAVEYEGDHHRTSEQLARDIRRAEQTAAIGWLERRVTKEDMHGDARAAVSKIRTALRCQGWRP
ncbi:hypothetical protein ACWF5H_10895 [Arthrobacter sp. NPDC055138]